MVAAQSDQGVVVFDSGGRRAMTFPNGNAVSWAPGELIAAIATPNEVLFVAPVSREVVSLPLPVDGPRLGGSVTSARRRSRNARSVGCRVSSSARA